MKLETDPRPAPGACEGMAEVRQCVDTLDRPLVNLLAERQRYMDAAVRIKPHAAQCATRPVSRGWSPR